MIRPKGLGRGLDALLAGTDDDASPKDALQTLPVDRLRPGKYQPRTAHGRGRRSPSSPSRSASRA